MVIAIAVVMMVVGYGSYVIFEWLLEIAGEREGVEEDTGREVQGEIRGRQECGKCKLTRGIRRARRASFGQGQVRGRRKEGSRSGGKCLHKIQGLVMSSPWTNKRPLVSLSRFRHPVATIHVSY